MSIGLGSDHAGYSLKKYLLEYLTSEYPNIKFRDFGCPSDKVSVDYPNIAQDLCKALTDNEIQRGILICGSGIGISIAANRFKGIRASLCQDIFAAKLTREHNDSNVLCLGNWFVTPKMAEQIANTWINTEFHGDKHLRRVELIDSI
ncbi:MAG: ribose 5-phosphate isomerase B [Candidatus Caenarcaniphilales bacterium]|nr:ribose 5-phosphate isomerase B [Candidatus Caenarcaniphilales bacterium]